jgi:glutamate-ammonia-ligase adenylyltransferase
VYRRYIDYSAIDSLRSMKRMIVAEVRRRGLEGNVKLGSGGIREVEFIAQCFQLIRGGRDRSLQQRELLPVLAECAALGCLPADHVDELTSAYLFLRNVEHGIQAWEDRQTQELPLDDRPRAALAHAMGYADWEAFTEELDAQRERVSRHFDHLIEDREEAEIDPAAVSLWSADCDADELAKLGYRQAEASAQRVSDLFCSRRVQVLQAEGRERLDRFMPLLLQACAEVDEPDLALERALPLVTAVARRSAYLLLLIENPPALADLASLCSASPWIAEQLTQHPALLDELLDRPSLYTAPDRDELASDLRQQTARLSTDDLEGYMLALRYFKASQVLRVAASEVAGRLPLMKVSDKLSFIAEVCLEQVLSVAWDQLVARYGEPDRESAGTAFAIVGFGKLGGIELSYASDLDLVFLYDARSGGATRGERSIDNATFYTRLGQRIIHILETRTTFGQLYEVDMRLRPSGASGLLVSSFQGFERYEADDAWTWEHQALVRARAIAGDPELLERFESLRRDILCTEREAPALRQEVIEMRNKMRDHAGVRDTDAELDLKQGFGGIVDIEFMVQYAVLASAYREPELAIWSDNVRILETLARTGILSEECCRALNDAYLDLRSATHQLALQQRPGKAPAEAFEVHSQAVREAWNTLLGSNGGSAGNTVVLEGS